MTEPAKVRPRLGQITHADGTEIPIAFEETGDVGVFRAVTLDGQAVEFQAGDELGPGQAVSIDCNTTEASE